MILRPDGIVMPDGSIASDLEVCIEQGVIADVRPWRSAYREESGLLLSPAFVNAHSHLEYRDLLGAIENLAYWPWIREITRIKPTRAIADVLDAARTAAIENVLTGVTLVGETSDWPVSGLAMKEHELGGVIFQEVITAGEPSNNDKLAQIEQVRAKQQAETGIDCFLSPHAPYTVSEDVIRRIAAEGNPISIHVAESPYETEFLQHGTGPIAELWDTLGVDIKSPRLRPVPYLQALGALHSRTQLVHVCDVEDEDIELIADSGATVAHCPRSNRALGCPAAPIKRMIESGITIGLGLDSAASSGEIDMFAEMQCALSNGLAAKQVWRMATSGGANSVAPQRTWEIAPMTNPDLLLLEPAGATFETLIARGSPNQVVRTIRLQETVGT